MHEMESLGYISLSRLRLYIAEDKLPVALPFVVSPS